ncbi:hypothetical protein DXG01_007178 [Tephrocybe rancida]|nr:hypothetical protein DXG01_007178 [Tephrocybe rancida]
MPYLERRDDSPPIQIQAGGNEINTRPYAKGGGKPQVIKQGQMFQGRIQGGATREQIFGTHDYGSGYPDGGVLRGTNGRGFPFYFWPVAWTNPFIVRAGDAYLHPYEYGLPDNATRPGGPLSTLTYISNTPAGTTFHILTDYASAALLITSLTICAPFVNLSSAMPLPYLRYAVSPLPEQSLQYFRASSAVLTLDGYNNTAALVPQSSTPSYNHLLPGDTDMELLQCLNSTIGGAILLNEPPHGLSFAAIFFIVFTSIIAAFFIAAYCRVCTALCRAQKARLPRQSCHNLPSPSLPSTVPVQVKQPPKATMVIPSNGEPLSSGKAGELYEEDDVASLTKHAQAFAGVEGGERGYYEQRGDQQNPWWWASFGDSKRSHKGFENIEMDQCGTGGKR